ncbi:MAG TPA: SDR family oxidoreductase [bacterium]|nr:SDR family oxidoreductase [bacterium]
MEPMPSANFLWDQVCIVTGSARGIGKEIVLTLARQGARVVINYRTSEAAALALSGQIHDLGRECLTVRADVSRPEETQRLIEETFHRWGRIDLLVHNAGPFALKPLADTSIEEWQELIAGNLHSAFYCAKYALPLLREQGRGHLIFIGSIKADSLRARHHACPYGIAKTGIVLMAKTLAREEGHHGIRANVINPGAIEGGWATEARREWLLNQIPLGRLGTPADIAGAVLFLHSPQGSYCNGAVINLDGGLWL